MLTVQSVCTILLENIISTGSSQFFTYTDLIKGQVNPGLYDGCHNSGSTNCARQRKTFFVFSPAEGNFLLYRNFFQPFSYSDEEILNIIAIDPKGILLQRMSPMSSNFGMVDKKINNRLISLE
jgi:hypothetical protein